MKNKQQEQQKEQKDDEDVGGEVAENETDSFPLLNFASSTSPQ